LGSTLLLLGGIAGLGIVVGLTVSCAPVRVVVALDLGASGALVGARVSPSCCHRLE
jgi:hypothetical protein